MPGDLGALYELDNASVKREESLFRFGRTVSAGEQGPLLIEGELQIAVLEFDESSLMNLGHGERKPHQLARGNRFFPHRRRIDSKVGPYGRADYQEQPARHRPTVYAMPQSDSNVVAASSAKF